MTVNPSRSALIVIHGWGGTLLEAAARVTELLHVESFRQDGAFLVPRRQAALIRHLLNEPSEDANVAALRKLAVSHFLLSPPIPQMENKQQRTDDFARFPEERLRQEFPSFGIPIAPASRRRRAGQLRAEAETVLNPVLDVLNHLLDTFRNDPDAERTEAAVRTRLRELTERSVLHASLLPLLEHLRGMHETGGDLDTVASAALYAHSIRGAAVREGRECHYGRDYRFVFVNYHESLRHLEALAPADLYLADLPVGAFPGLAEDIRHLHQRGVHTARFEDHHPYRTEQRDALAQLQHDGVLGVLALSGPVQGTEQPDEAQTCAADMVYANNVRNTTADTAGARRLREAAHGEDFVRGRTPLGILLTDLIKGGICKAELAQLLVESMTGDDAMQRLGELGWATLPARWKAEMDATAETILENISRITLAGSGTTIIAALAVHAEPGQPKLPTGKAIEFIARAFPDAQYAFYCYGSSLMVARRLDHADTALNMGSLMPSIGTANDGGHAGAAVCRPDANPAYPTRLLRKISSSNFTRFTRYLADRIAAEGYPVAGVRDLSAPSHARWRHGSRRLLIVLAAALTLGLAIIALFPAFRPDAIRESNAAFLPYMALDADLTAEPGEEGDDL